MDDTQKTRAQLLQEVAALRQQIADLSMQRTTSAEAYRQAACVHEARLNAIVEDAVDGIITIDEQGRIESFNPAAERLFGYRAAAVIGQNIAMLMPSPDREAHDSYLRRYLQTGDKRVIGTGREVTGQRRDGSTFPIELTVSEGRLGDCWVFTGIVRDLSERMQAEAALQDEKTFISSLLDTVQVIILVLDRQGRIVRFNTYMEALSGYRLAEVQGQDWITTFLPVRDWDRIRTVFEQAAGGIPTRGNVNSIVTRTGQERQIEWFDTRLTDASGEVTGLLSIGQDITERKRMEVSLRRSEHLALLGRLAAGVSHELRNPLSTIFLHMDMIEEELWQPSPDSQAQIRKSIVEIKIELPRMQELVEDYLSLARLSAMRREQADLGTFVKACAQEKVEQLASHGITLSLRGLASLGEVAFHPNTLRRALANLMQNALEAMPEGGRLSIRGQRTRSYVRLEICDTGLGIPEDELPLIFEPLHTTKPDGTGLGLYLVQEIVAAHEGQIDVYSIPGAGTTFTLTLPRA